MLVVYAERGNQPWTIGVFRTPYLGIPPSPPFRQVAVQSTASPSSSEDPWWGRQVGAEQTWSLLVAARLSWFRMNLGALISVCIPHYPFPCGVAWRRFFETGGLLDGVLGSTGVCHGSVSGQSQEDCVSVGWAPNRRCLKETGHPMMCSHLWGSSHEPKEAKGLYHAESKFTVAGLALCRCQIADSRVVE